MQKGRRSLTVVALAAVGWGRRVRLRMQAADGAERLQLFGEAALAFEALELPRKAARCFQVR